MADAEESGQGLERLQARQDALKKRLNHCLAREESWRVRMVRAFRAWLKLQTKRRGLSRLLKDVAFSIHQAKRRQSGQARGAQANGQNSLGDSSS